MHKQKLTASTLISDLIVAARDWEVVIVVTAEALINSTCDNFPTAEVLYAVNCLTLDVSYSSSWAQLSQLVWCHLFNVSCTTARSILIDP